MPPSPRDPAPDFDVLDHAGKRHRLADYRGRRLVLFFYPRADTPGCTAEACAFRDLAGDFARKDAAILGVSTDAAPANAAFAHRHHLAFPLLCDIERSMCVAYGACDDDRAESARRVGVVIGPDGLIESVEPKVDARAWPAAVLGRL